MAALLLHNLPVRFPPQFRPLPITRNAPETGQAAIA